jgi:hypothetical protein
VNRPTADERLLLRAALLDPGGLEAWQAYVTQHGGIDHLDGDGLSLLPMVFGNLGRRDPDAPEMGRLRGIYRRTWYANHMLLHAAAQAVVALQEAGVGAMLVGGSALVALHSGDAGLRPIATVDLAVAAGDRASALRVLAGSGWSRPARRSVAAGLRDWSHVRLTRAGREQLVLHCVVRRLHRAGGEQRAVAGTATVGGVAIRIPAATDQLLLACIGRRRTPPPSPLRWIPEAALVIRAGGAPIDRARLRARARARGAVAELDEALRLLATDYGLELSTRRPRQAPTGPRAGVRIAGRLGLRRVADFRRLSLDGAIATLVPALRARGVSPLLIKGPALAQWLYDDPRERSYGDIDLLIAPAEFPLAEQVMAEHGFIPVADGLRSTERPRHHERWVRPGAQEIAFELHRTLALLTDLPPSLVWQRLTAETVTIEVGGVAIETPAEPAAALILCLHVAQHGMSERRPMIDLARALERVDMPTWRRAAALADQLEARPAFAAGLQLVPGGRELCRVLDLAPDLPWRLRLRRGENWGLAMKIDALVSTRGARARMRFVGDHLIPSRQKMLVTSPLARRGRVGVLGAYLYRPFHLLGRFHHGLRAWRKAAQGAEQLRPGTNVSGGPAGPDLVRHSEGLERSAP